MTSPPGRLQPSPAEATTAAVARHLEGRSFASREEARAFLAQLAASGTVPPPPATTPLQAAQDIAYRAWEATGAERAELARQALATCADCADAWVILASAAADPDEADRLWDAAVAAGERALGLPAGLAALAGHFWSDVTTRPYLRARLGRARHRQARGETEAAVAEFRELLALNPTDQQGVRYLLAAELLRLGRDAEAERLLDQYPDDPSADWAYHRLLLALRRGASATARERLLRQALRRNALVPDYLLGLSPLPAELPDALAPGGEAEAVHCAALAGPAWRATPAALTFLAKDGEEPAGSPADAGWEPDAELLQGIADRHPEFRVLRERWPGGEVRVAGISPDLHLHLHAVVANQVARDDPPAARELLAALLAAGADRHEAEHVIMGVLSRAIFPVLRHRQPFDTPWYEARLRFLARLAKAMAAGEPAPPRPRRGDPCPCGSGHPARDCCLDDGWPPLPVITPEPPGRPRPGLLMILGEGRFAPRTVLARRGQDDGLLLCENATHVAEALARVGDYAGALAVYRQVVEVAAALPPPEAAAHLPVALAQLARHCLRSPDLEAEGREAVARLAELTGEAVADLERRLRPGRSRR